MMLALKLRPKYGSLVNTYVDLGTMWADAPIEIRARAQEDRLQILKTLEAQASPDAMVSESPDVQNPISEPALHTPDVQDPKTSGRCLSRRLIRQMRRNRQDPQNKLPMSEQALHSSAKRDCASRGAPLEGMPNADWVLSVGAVKIRAHFHRPYVQFCLQQIKSAQSPCTDKELAKAGRN